MECNYHASNEEISVKPNSSAHFNKATRNKQLLALGNEQLQAMHIINYYYEVGLTLHPQQHCSNLDKVILVKDCQLLIHTHCHNSYLCLVLIGWRAQRQTLSAPLASGT